MAEPPSPPEPRKFSPLWRFIRNALLLVVGSGLAIVALTWCEYRKTRGDGITGAADTFTYRRHLPSTARDIREWAWADGFLPDFDYLLKARVTQAEFDAFVQKLRLTPHTPGRVYTERNAPPNANPADALVWLSWSGSASLPPAVREWWTPSGSLDATLVGQDGDHWEYAKYEDGWLYFRALSH